MSESFVKTFNSKSWDVIFVHIARWNTAAIHVSCYLSCISSNGFYLWTYEFRQGYTSHLRQLSVSLINLKRKKSLNFGKYKYETHVSLTIKTHIGALKHEHEWETVPSLTMIKVLLEMLHTIIRVVSITSFIKTTQESHVSRARRSPWPPLKNMKISFLFFSFLLCKRAWRGIPLSTY